MPNATAACRRRRQFRACSARFRPILMTTMAALFAGIPLVIATGPGTELRRPLGITIIGGLFVSQILTLYTTPVIYLLIDRLAARADPESESRAGTVAEEVPECPHCGKPLALCVCDGITPIDNKVALLILQHPQEQDRTLGTARLTALHFKDAVLKIGLSWPSLSKVLGRPVADPSALGGALSRLGQGGDTRPRTRDRRGQPQGRDRAGPGRQRCGDIEGIVLLDGTWSQAKALWWRNAWMLKCQRVVLGPRRPSRYGKLRNEPRARRPVDHRGGGTAAGGARADGPISPRRSAAVSSDCSRVTGKCRRQCRNSHRSRRRRIIAAARAQNPVKAGCQIGLAKTECDQ